jgi:hypothetical protein
MKTYIAITVLNGGDSSADELTDCINRLLCTPLSKQIVIYDLTQSGVGREIKALGRSYARYGVILKQIKRASKLKSLNERANFGVAQSLLDFNAVRSRTFDCFIHINQNMLFDNFDLQLLADNARFYSALSPVVESFKGLEIWDAVFDRFGVSYSKQTKAPTLFITGAVEESYTLNPKCFALSQRFASRLKNFTVSSREPVDYLNGLIYANTDSMPKLDTNLFVHENLY